jgi:hypothetical protein
MDRQEEKKKDPFYEWLDYAFKTTLAIDVKFAHEQPPVKAAIIEKALKPYHFWLEEKGISLPQKITANQRTYIEKILSLKNDRSRKIAQALNKMKKGLEDLTKEEASELLEETAK